MAATKSRALSVKSVQTAQRNTYPIKAGAHIFADCFVGMEAASGYARALVAGDKCLGLATMEVDNTSGANGDLTIEVIHGEQVQMPVSAAVITSVGSQVYASDDQTAQLSSAASASKCGWVREFVNGTTCWVQLTPPELN